MLERDVEQMVSKTNKQDKCRFGLLYRKHGDITVSDRGNLLF